MSKQEEITPDTATQMVNAQHASNKIKQKGFNETIKLLTSINVKLDRIHTQLANNAEIQNAAAQQPPATADQWSNLPWRPYKSGHGGWIFATNQDGTPNQKAKTIISALNKNGGKVTTSTATYKFSGENNKFISRTPR